jgi:hypothetical protein
MNFMEMVLALMAIVFFTTVSLVYNRSMWTQAENLDNVAKVMQATQLAHSKLDEIDAKLFAGKYFNPKFKFSDVKTTFTGSNILCNLAFSGYKFKLSYAFAFCDTFGLEYADQASPPSVNTFKMTTTISSTPGMSHTVAVSRIYTKISLYQ